MKTPAYMPPARNIAPPTDADLEIKQGFAELRRQADRLMYLLLALFAGLGLALLIVAR